MRRQEVTYGPMTKSLERILLRQGRLGCRYVGRLERMSTGRRSAVFVARLVSMPPTSGHGTYAVDVATMNAIGMICAPDSNQSGFSDADAEVAIQPQVKTSPLGDLGRAGGFACCLRHEEFDVFTSAWALKGCWARRPVLLTTTHSPK